MKLYKETHYKETATSIIARNLDSVNEHQHEASIAQL